MASIYHKKQKWKFWLIVAASLIVGASLWYTSLLVDTVAREEREKATLWAEAIQKKASLVRYTEELFQKLAGEERKRMELWASATEKLSTAETDFDFYLNIVQSNKNIPVILTNEQFEITSFLNFDSVPNVALSDLTPNQLQYLEKQLAWMREERSPIELPYYENRKNYLYYKDSKLFSELKTVMEDLISSFISEIVVNSATVPVIYADDSLGNAIAFGNLDSNQYHGTEDLRLIMAEMALQNPPITVELGENRTHYIYYFDSFLLTQLKYFPLVQFGIIGLFLLVAYMMFSTARKAEQNQVWVGMAKETAHQLGTPLSSLMAWLEIMRDQNMDPVMVTEIQKDINRLNTITERFSKIGSTPALKHENIRSVLESSLAYLRTRVSTKVSLSIKGPETDVLLNVPLFEWVIENLVKNAIDAMGGKGSIEVVIQDMSQFVYLDITDTGKGIPKSLQRTVFQPGYTTRARGWGLGLSLARRIIENYHNGKIFVKKSDPSGTTFRLVLPK